MPENERSTEKPVPWAPHISPALSLIVVVSILAVTVVASLLASRRAEKAEASSADNCLQREIDKLSHIAVDI